MRWWDRLRGRDGSAGRVADPYEATARRMDEQRRYSELGQPMAPVAGQVARARRRQMIWLLAIVVLAVAFIAAKGRSANQPLAAADCGPVALTTGATSVASGAALRYTVTGPASTSVIVTVDIERLVPDPATGGFRYQPRAGVPLAQTVRDQPRALTGCRYTSFVVATFPAGAHVLAVFDAHAGGDALAVRDFVVTG